MINALKALRSGREDAYEGKQLGYGPQSHDLRDCAELKVSVVQEFTRGGQSVARLVYREFEPQRQGVQTTPHRIPVPPDLIRQAAILRDSPPAGTAARPASAPQATVNRPDGPGRCQSQER